MKILKVICSLLFCVGVGAFYYLTIPDHSSEPEASNFKILFIGNSLTEVNHLPRLVYKMSKSTDSIVFQDMYAPGGATFKNHADDNLLSEKIKGHNWDYVVLQGQSQETALNYEHITKNVAPYVVRLVNKIKENNTNTKVLLYMTMANKNGDVSNPQAYDNKPTFEKMQDRVNQTYFYLASLVEGVEVAPVGLAWKKMRESEPNLDLYLENDTVHPNIYGSYLASCVIFSKIFDKKCSETGWTSHMTFYKGNFMKIQKVADSVSF